MRDYAQVSPKFWTGPTGRQIRAMGQSAQLVAIYLLTGPNSSMIGLYYLPLVTLAHETNLEVAEARQVLAALSTIDYSHYDDLQETVWVVNMGFYQVGETVETRDKRWLALVRELLAYTNCPFFPRFLDLYGDAFHLREALQAPLDGTASPLQGPSKGLRRATRKQKQSAEAESSPSQGPTEGLPLAPSSENQAPPMPGTGKGKGTGTGTRTEEGTEAPSSLPEFLVKDLIAIGIVLPAAQMSLFQKLGRSGLRSALVKLRTKGGGKPLAGLLVSHGAELAMEGWGLLQEEAVQALAGAPEALKDPRWAPLPLELREDLEVQTAWAKWIKTETHMYDCPGDDEAPKVEKAARRPLLALLTSRHPDGPGLKARLEECTLAASKGGLTPTAVKLLAESMALGLAAAKGGARDRGQR
jgi:hypothetical protein